MQIFTAHGEMSPPIAPDSGHPILSGTKIPLKNLRRKEAQILLLYAAGLFE
ncbi:MAG: hypothetical protein JWN14_2873 [Chthonomonadales bacterium]|nr:hypothetical protein [Chthonomonadales bacterium]